ncbi:MAG: hypothetical protein M3R48_01340 [Candidatus Dormibacteraeota bacterium]|nr:hypothetical protein [Candidatus Dormibacteraeota bacterium]
MNTFEITELGQIGEQENMRRRAQTQAVRRAGCSAHLAQGRPMRTRGSLRHRFTTLLGIG